MSTRGKSPKPERSRTAKAPVKARLSAGRLWAFRLVALSLPALFLVFVELGLRLSGYGYPTQFFKEIRDPAGKRLVTNNEHFSLRFFPPELARWPTSFVYDAEKPKDVHRIFVFGESAAMGDPQPAYGASRYLDRLLGARFPGEKFEVINLGITAINSHVVLPIAQECARQQGDLWIIYTGNNEMVGPFGAATVFGARALPRVAARFNLALQRTRTGQLLMTWLRHLGGKPDHTSWGGMEMFLKHQIRPDDPGREIVYRNFEANLRDIVDAGLKSGARVILCTMSVNLRDCPPFASLINSNQPVAQRDRFESLLVEAKTLQQQSNYAGAATRFSDALQLDPLFAEAHFRRGQCLVQLSNATAATEFQAACDSDALPFRADSRINSAIRNLAQARASSGLSLCDAEAILAASGPLRVAGQESFYEHVHFNLTGNYRLGLAWAEAVEKMLPPDVLKQSAAGWAEPEWCDRELGLSVWNRQFITQAVIRRMGQPPLSTQFNNAARLAVVQAEDRELLSQQSQAGAAAGARLEFQQLLQRWPQDPFLHEGFANFLEATEDKAGAVTEYRRMVEMLPHDFYASLQLGRLLGEGGQPGSAEPFLVETTRLRPSLPDGWHELGTVLAAQEKYGPALECMLRAEQIRPQDPANICYTGKVLAKMKRRGEAIERYRRAIQLRPGFWEARFELAGELALNNEIAAATQEYFEVVKLNPRHVTSHINLGVMLTRVNQLDQAIKQFDEALRLEPANRAAREYRAQVQARRATPP